MDESINIKFENIIVDGTIEFDSGTVNQTLTMELGVKQFMIREGQVLGGMNLTKPLRNTNLKITIYGNKQSVDIFKDMSGTVIGPKSIGMSSKD